MTEFPVFNNPADKEDIIPDENEKSLIVPMTEEDILSIESNTINILRILKKYYKVKE